MAADGNAIQANLARISERMARAAERVGRRADEITLVAVSKTFPVGAIRAAYQAGLREFGENRVQEWKAKRPQLEDLDGTWHLIGHLQSNKVRPAAQLFDRVDSVDSLSLAEKLEMAASEVGKRLPVLIEVRMGDDETKSGVMVSDLPALAKRIAALEHLELRGLMTIPPFFEEAERARPYFAKLRGLRDELSGRIGRALPVLSMGMSHDFEIAIEEGATEVRIGTALFGERNAAD